MPKGPKIIVDTGITAKHSNGARAQEIIYEAENKEKFRIYIHSESYDFQSYARLYKWSNEKGWLQIHQVNPAKDYNINLSYRPIPTYNAFAPIIRDLNKIMKAFITPSEVNS